MSDGIYVGMSAAVARSRQLDAVADNLANAQTPGFKASRPAFEAVLDASGARIPTEAISTGIDLRPGTSTRTGNGLDLLPGGDAFLALRLASGATAYTRDGRLSVDADGFLVGAGGHPILDGAGKAIRLPPGETARIAEDGTVYGGTIEVAKLGLWRIDGGAERIGPSLLEPAAGVTTTPSDAGVRVGEIELGNAAPLEAAVALVTAQRGFDHAMQAIQTYRKLDERANELGRVR